MSKEFKVTKSGGNLEAWTSMFPILETFTQVLQKDIHVENPHGEPSDVSDDKNVLTIKFYCQPKGGNNKSKDYQKVFGYRLDSGQDDGRHHTGTGFPLSDPAGLIVGEIIDSTIFVHFDLPHSNNEAAGKVLTELLMEYCKATMNGTKAFSEFQKDLEEAKKAASRKNYIQEVSKRFQRNLNETKKNIENGHKEIENLQRTLTKRIREVQGLEAKLEQLQSREGDELEKFGREYDLLLQVPKVIDVQIADGVIKIFTDTIICQDDRTGKWHEIGKFRIEIYTSGANGGVRWFNLTRRIPDLTYCFAPHVKASGEACLGNTKEVFPELIAKYEFSVAAMLAIEFVSSCNTGDEAGKYINRWPLVDPQP